MSRIPRPAAGPYGYAAMPRAYFYEPDVPDFQDSDLDPLNAEPSYECYSGVEHEHILGAPGNPQHLNTDINDLCRRKYVIQGQMTPSPNPQAHYYYPQPVPLPLPLPPLYRRVPPGRLSPPRPISPNAYYGHMMNHEEHPNLIRHHHHNHNQPIWSDYYEGTGGPHMVRPNTAHLVKRNYVTTSQVDSTQQESSIKSKIKTTKTPVSVRTPRFYRRLTGPDMYRRMSALCLPMACQVDPAKKASKVHHRHQNRDQESKRHHHRNEACQKTVKTRTMVTPKIKNSASDILPVIDTVERCGDFNNMSSNKASNMKDIFTRYQKVFDKCTLTDENDRNDRNDLSDEPCSVKSRVSKSSKYQKSVKKLSPHLLKPKLPPSLIRSRKKKRSQGSHKQEISDTESSNLEIFEPKLEIEPMTTEQLDKMLNEMTAQSETSSPREKLRNSTKQGIGDTDEILVRAKSENGENCPQNDRIEMNSNEKIKNSQPASLNYAELTKLMEQHGIGSENEMGGEHCQRQEAVSSSNIPTSHTSVALNSRPATRQNNYESKRNEDHYGDTSNLQRFSDKLSEISSPLTTRSKRSPWTASSGAAGDQNRPKTAQTNAYQSVDDHSAIEIHQSKSYIVNLIDRALSREFRTLPEANSKPASFMDQISAKNSGSNSISIVTKNPNTTITVLPNSQCSNCHGNSSIQGGSISNHYENSDEINITKENFQSEIRVDNNTTREQSDCLLSTGDETMCIKQLKKLRYGHLKHIQREMRKLEHLERFIDSYTTESNT